MAVALDVFWEILRIMLGGSKDFSPISQDGKADIVPEIFPKSTVVCLYGLL